MSYLLSLIYAQWCLVHVNSVFLEPCHRVNLNINFHGRPHSVKIKLLLLLLFFCHLTLCKQKHIDRILSANGDI